MARRLLSFQRQQWPAGLTGGRVLCPLGPGPGEPSQGPHDGAARVPRIRVQTPERDPDGSALWAHRGHTQTAGALLPPQRCPWGSPARSPYSLGTLLPTCLRL